MRNLLTYLLCLSLVFLPGCQALGMTPEQIESARTSLTQQRDVGNITQAQYDAAVEALDNPAGVNWEALLLTGGSVLTSVLLGVPIAVGQVQKRRGPVATPQEKAARMAAGSKA